MSAAVHHDADRAAAEAYRAAAEFEVPELYAVLCAAQCDRDKAREAVAAAQGIAAGIGQALQKYLYVPPAARGLA
jgi:hypothetical protein